MVLESYERFRDANVLPLLKEWEKERYALKTQPVPATLQEIEAFCEKWAPKLEPLILEVESLTGPANPRPQSVFEAYKKSYPADELVFILYKEKPAVRRRN